MSLNRVSKATGLGLGLGLPSMMAAHNVYSKKTEPKTYFLSEIDEILKTELPEIRREIFRPEKGEMFGLRRNIAQVAVSTKLIDDQFIIQHVPKDKQPFLKGLVNCLQAINGQTGLGSEAARRGAEAAVVAYNVHTNLEDLDKKVNDPEALEQWNEFKTNIGGKTRIRKKYKRQTRSLSKHTRK